MLQIEPHTIADLPTIEAFIAALHDAERELMPILSPGAELAAAGVRQMLHDISANKGTALLAKSEGRPIGFGCVLFDDYRDPSYVEAERRRAYFVLPLRCPRMAPPRGRSGSAGVYRGRSHRSRLFEICYTLQDYEYVGKTLLRSCGLPAAGVNRLEADW
jgi:hypothetical protein